MFLEVAENDLEPGKAYLLGTWPLKVPAKVKRKDVGVFFGPITPHRLAMDILSKSSTVVTHRIPEGEQVIAWLADNHWRVGASTKRNTPAYQDFGRISIYIEEE